MNPFRTLSAITLAATFALAGLLPCEAAHAAAPMVRTQAPGYYRLMLGDYEITALSDGTLDIPVDKLLAHITPAGIDGALARSFLKAPVETSVNAYLINTGTRLILVDTGAAGLFGPTAGRLAANLLAAGYRPEQIDEVYITHMHPDHIGGLVAGGQPAFPNATVRADRHDADYWLSQENLEHAAADARPFFQDAMDALRPYIAAGRFAPFVGGAELAPGIEVVNTFGHTPGHSSFVVQSQGQTMVIWGDLVHVAAVQYDDPSVTIGFDTEPGPAVRARKLAFADAARGGYLVAAAHMAFPGLGHVRPEGKAYLWVPLNYALPR